jgi:hypothetical protein
MYESLRDFSGENSMSQSHTNMYTISTHFAMYKGEK